MEDKDKIVLGKGWNLDDILDYLHKHGAEVDMDNEGQIILYTELYENGDGELYLQ